jgi:hypothetical protein
LHPPELKTIITAITAAYAKLLLCLIAFAKRNASSIRISEMGTSSGGTQPKRVANSGNVSVLTG